jgi:hypothetical protein
MSLRSLFVDCISALLRIAARTIVVPTLYLLCRCAPNCNVCSSLCSSHTILFVWSCFALHVYCYIRCAHSIVPSAHVVSLRSTHAYLLRSSLRTCTRCAHPCASLVTRYRSCLVCFAALIVKTDVYMSCAHDGHMNGAKLHHMCAGFVELCSKNIPL